MKVSAMFAFLLLPSKLRSPLASMSLCLLLTASATAHSQTKMDADDSDLTALVQKIAYAHSEKIAELERNNDINKACRSGKVVHGRVDEEDASEACVNASMGEDNAVREQILLKGCSYPHTSGSRANSCYELAYYYVNSGRNFEALAALRTPNAVDLVQDEKMAATVARIRYKAYQTLGNAEYAKEEATDLCNSGIGGTVEFCFALQRLGEQVDMDAVRQKQEDVQAQNKADAAQHEQDEQQNRRNQAANRAAIDAAISSIGATQQSTYPAPAYSSHPVQSDRTADSSVSQASSPSNECRYVTSSVVLTPHFSREPASSWCTNGSRMDVGWTVSNSSGSGVTCAIKFGQDPKVNYQNYSGGGQLENACAFDDKVQYVCWRTDDNAACSGRAIDWTR
jgi:hypothetical protein